MVIQSCEKLWRGPSGDRTGTGTWLANRPSDVERQRVADEAENHAAQQQRESDPTAAIADVVLGAHPSDQRFALTGRGRSDLPDGQARRFAPAGRRVLCACPMPQRELVGL